MEAGEGPWRFQWTSEEGWRGLRRIAPGLHIVLQAEQRLLPLQMKTLSRQAKHSALVKSLSQEMASLRLASSSSSQQAPSTPRRKQTPVDEMVSHKDDSKCSGSFIHAGKETKKHPPTVKTTPEVLRSLNLLKNGFSRYRFAPCLWVHIKFPWKKTCSNSPLVKTSR